MFEVSGSGGEKMDARRHTAKERELHRDRHVVHKKEMQEKTVESSPPVRDGDLPRRPASLRDEASSTRRYVYLRDGDGRPRR